MRSGRRTLTILCAVAVTGGAPVSVATASILAPLNTRGGPRIETKASATERYYSCGHLSLFGIENPVHVTIHAACAVWSAALSERQKLVSCHGRPYTAGSYPVLHQKTFHGWRISEGKRSPIRFSQGDQSFFGAGQDVPPYPC